MSETTTTYYTMTSGGFATQVNLASDNSTLVYEDQGSFDQNLVLEGTNPILSVDGSIQVVIPGGSRAGTYNATYLGFTVIAPSATYIPVVTFTSGPYSDITFILDGQSNGANETLVQGTLCFGAETRIATPDGWTVVRGLRVGDVVRTASGAARPIRWVGHRTIDPSQFASFSEVLPVRIAAHAITANMPNRDLFLSPEHAILIDGHLVAVRHLLNGGSVTQIDDLSPVDYYHIELGSHDVVLAEGLPCETYLDLDNRGQFGSSEGVVAPWFGATRAASCAPFLTKPDALHRHWQRVADRSETLGLPCPAAELSDDPLLCLLIGGEIVTPTSVEGTRYKFRLEGRGTRVEMLSRATAPQDVRPWVRDHRCLGVALRRMTIDCGRGQIAFAADELDFEGLPGWWQGEAGFRWSTGRAELPLHDSAKMELELDITPGLYRTAASQMAKLRGAAQKDVSSR